ncbi:MAG: phosphate ABC transporter substrate-binding protein [Proteobacteria bacterium]|nr:phosphate ABC transporter substrate-binding protein [Pseudomonadota bacterium]
MKKMVLGFTLIFAASVLAETTPTTNTTNKPMIQIKGSDTLVNTVQVLAEKYMAKNPGKVISVTGGGSGTGIAALLNGTCSIADSSREIKPKEKEMAKDKVNEIIVGIDGLSVIVNKNNKISSLTIEQLGKIYRGEVTNWKDIGGKDMSISLYGRQPNSGTFDFFREHVVKADYSKEVKEMNGNAQIVESVKNAVSGIGYVGAGYTQNSKEIKVLAIASKTGEKAYKPTFNNVETKLYPISRPLYQYISGNISEDVKNFLAYEVSAEGQKVVTEEGFFPINDKQKESNYALLGITMEKAVTVKVKKGAKAKKS